MEQFKREIFESEMGRQFVEIIEAGNDERMAVLDSLYSILKLDYNYNLYTYLLQEFNATTVDDTYSTEWASSFFKEHPVYIFWNQNEVDKINMDDLVKYWNFIWYDVSDEAIILYQVQTGRVGMICNWGGLVLVQTGNATAT